MEEVEVVLTDTFLDIACFGRGRGLELAGVPAAVKEECCRFWACVEGGGGRTEGFRVFPFFNF